MQKNNHIDNSSQIFTASDLKALRDALPGKYYPQFQEAWKRLYGKESVPLRQAIYAVLNEKAENDKIITALIAVVEERKLLQKRLKNAINPEPQVA